MKKLLFLLLLSVSGYSQAVFDEGIQITGGQTTTSTTSKILSQESSGVVNTIDAANLPLSTATTNALFAKKDATSTAVTSTAILTNNGSTFTLSPLTGVIVDNSTVPSTRTVINFAGASNVTPLYFRTLLYIDNTGTLQQMNGMSTDLTPQQKVDNLFIGIVVYSGGAVQVVQLIPNIEYGIDNRFSVLTDFLRNINEGNNIGANGTNLQINKGAGYTFRRGSNFSTNREVPDVTTDVAATPIPASPNLIGFRNGSGGWTYEAYTGSLTPQFWDDGTGVKATVANNKFTNQRVYFFNGTNTYVIYLGRTEHATLEAAATAAQSPDAIVDPATSVGSLIGTISVAYNAAALNNTAQARFTQGPRMQGGTGAGGASGSQNLQNTYLNSSVPQITTTALGAVTVKEGTGNDANNVLVGKNNAGTTTFSVSGAGNITGGSYNGYTPENSANKATDFTTVNNTLYPTVQAVKTYSDGLVLGYLNDRGGYNASTNLFPSTGGSGPGGSILKGDIWYAISDGILGGRIIRTDDSLRALMDSPGQTASNWSLISYPLQYIAANDSDAIHKTGNETKTGNLTVDNLYTTSKIGVGISSVIGQFQVRTGTNENASFLSNSGRVTLSSFNDAVSANIGLDMDALDYRFNTSGSLKMLLDTGGLTLNSLSGVSDRLVSADSNGRLIISTAPTAPTAPVGTNTTQIATTAFVQATTNSNALLLTGDQTFTGTKSSTLSTLTTGIDIYNNEAGNAIRTTTTSGGAGLNSINTSNGWAVLASNSGSGTGVRVINSSTTGGVGVSVNGTSGSNGALFRGSNNGTTTFDVTKEGTVMLGTYTVATLPTPTTTAYATATDVLTPTYLGTAVGGGTVVTPVFYNGTTWVCH